MASAERLARNEQLFSEVNQRIADIAESFAEGPAPIQFVCECAFLECTDQIELTPAQYEELRSRDGCYAVKRGHEVGPEIESVVGEHGDVLVVRKHVTVPDS